MTTETKKFDAEIGKVLQLMIHSLYTNKDIFLRELISNASDACDKLRYQAIERPELLENRELKISVSIDKKNNSIIVSDNGIGMNKNDLIENLGTIAKSGTQNFLSMFTGDKKHDLELIGQFGVGFYSSFMVAEEVEVISRKAGEEEVYIWKSRGDGEYTISDSSEWIPAFAGMTPSDQAAALSPSHVKSTAFNGDILSAAKEKNGTQITLKLRPSEVEYLEKYSLKHIIKTYSDHIAFPIELISLEDSSENAEIVNTASAIWTRQKNELTEEDYQDFYQHVAHSPDKPWMTLHNKVEGNIEYTNLLYIPSQKPFDLFNPERKGRVKLYVKKVFIADDAIGILPAYLRFMRGVVDSSDLPLNISRETLQNNLVIHKINKSLTKKILTELKKKAEENKQEYALFWDNFGEVVKEGLCEPAIAEKELLLEVCRFHTSSSGDELVSLDEYIARMKEFQEDIYYLTGENLDKLRNNPQLEGFKKRGIEVILLNHTVDDFWVNVINQYKNKSLKSITRAGIELDEVSPIDKNEANQNHEEESEKALIDFFKTTLGKLVRDVKISGKLVDTPACLTVPEGAMDIRMEKYLLEQKQLNAASAKILEINAKSALVQKIADDIKNSSISDETKDLANIIFDQACIIEGVQVSDPNMFSKRINSFLQKAVV